MMQVELNHDQIVRLHNVVAINKPISSAIYLGDGLFSINDGEVSFSLEPKDVDFIIKGIKLTRGQE